MKVIQFSTEKKWVDKFLKLPKSLYTDDKLTNSYKQEKNILLKKHTLSHYFSITPLLIIDEKEKPLARLIIAFYENDENAYLGYFECIDDLKVAKLLFESAENYCKKNNKNTIIGPVDASVWIKYRLKINNFNIPYTNEPYNKDYYYKLFLDNDYIVRNHFISNIYPKTDSKSENPKAQKRLAQKIEQGYIIKSPDPKKINEHIKELYSLYVELFNKFPLFKMITPDEFSALLKKLSTVSDVSMIKAAYFNDELVGFLISLPNYGSNICGNLNLKKLKNIMKLKKNADEFILLYLGVKKGHAGLGLAMTQLIVDEMIKREIKIIGALIQDGKVTGNYFSNCIVDVNEYVLLHKPL